MKRVMIALLKWLSRVLALVAAVVLIPYAARFAATMWPDPASAITCSVTLSEKLSSSARLETNVLDKEAALDSKVEAALIGTVQEVRMLYTYHASMGIDLSKVQVSVKGKTITLRLPPVEILSDSITPTESYVDDFWFKLTETRRQKLLDDELQKCREAALQDWASSEQARQNTLDAVQNTIAEWVSLAGIQLQLEWEDA